MCTLKLQSGLDIFQGCSTTKQQNEFWKEVSEEEGPWESRRVDGMTKCRNMPPHFSIRKTCATVRRRNDWRKNIVEAMARKGSNFYNNKKDVIIRSLESRVYS
jgi:hypothetical protein